MSIIWLIESSNKEYDLLGCNAITSIELHQHFEETYRLCLQGRSVHQARSSDKQTASLRVSCFAHSSTLNMDAIHSSETLVDFCHTILHGITTQNNVCLQSPLWEPRIYSVLNYYNTNLAIGSAGHLLDANILKFGWYRMEQCPEPQSFGASTRKKHCIWAKEFPLKVCRLW
jgi:hypothetical protein